MTTKKEIEARVLTAARDAGVPIPTGEIPGEESDFRFVVGASSLGIEVTELLRPAKTMGGVMPVEEERFHQRVVRMAQKLYYSSEGAKPARVGVTFGNALEKNRTKHSLARSLVEFVSANLIYASPAVAYSWDKVPKGFGPMSIASEFGDWWCDEGGSVTFSDIRRQLTSRIEAKNNLLPRYRAKLPKGAQVWLLIYSTAAVSRSMPIPYGIEAWKFPFGFERVFWFDSFGGEFVEIRRLGPYK